MLGCDWPDGLGFPVRQSPEAENPIFLGVEGLGAIRLPHPIRATRLLQPLIALFDGFGQLIDRHGVKCAVIVAGDDVEILMSQPVFLTRVEAQAQEAELRGRGC